MTKNRSDGEGSVYQLHTAMCDRPPKGCKCKWRGVLVIGYRDVLGKDGKRRKSPMRKIVTASTRSGAATKLRELREKQSANTLPIGKAPTVEQWLNHWHGVILPRTKAKQSTLNNYRKTIDNYLIPLLGWIRLDRLRPEDIEAAWDVLAQTGNPTRTEDRPLAANTIHHAHVILTRALRVAVQRKKITANPAGPDAMDAPPKVDHEIEPLTLEESRAVLAAAADVVNAARWTVALALGLRQGEALALRWSDVDLDDDVLYVRRTVMRLPGRGLVFDTPKSEASKRDIVLPSSLAAALRAHRKAQNTERLVAGSHWQDHDLVFAMPDGRPIDPRVDAKRWKALLEDAGVKHYRLHDARHTAATILLAQKIDPRVVMDILGHSQLSTTMRYQHAVKEIQRDAAAKMDEAIRG